MRLFLIVIYCFLFTNDTFCMSKIIGESLAYATNPSYASVSEQNRRFFEDEQYSSFFGNLNAEISRWQYVDINDVAFECICSREAIFSTARSSLRSKLGGLYLESKDYAVALAGEILGYDGNDEFEEFDWSNDSGLIDRACARVTDKYCDAVKTFVEQIKQHISFSRVIVVDKIDETLSFRIERIPLLFLSGTYGANVKRLTDHPILKTMVRFIDTYNFHSTSDQTYSHSERALCLGLSEDFGDSPLSSFINKNTIDLCVQIRNLNRLCVNCDRFISGRSIYFINIGNIGCFVGNAYKADYEQASSPLKQRKFVTEHNYVLKLGFSVEQITVLNDFQLKSIFEQIVPKNIRNLIPHDNILFFETMNSDNLSEVVSIYLPCIGG